jgi:hypothetical protein
MWTFTKPKPNFTLSKDYSSTKVQFTGLFIGASHAALNVKLIHCIPQLSQILEIYVLTLFSCKIIIGCFW